MTELPNKTHLSPDGAILNEDGGFVLPNGITAKTLLRLDEVVTFLECPDAAYAEYRRMLEEVVCASFGVDKKELGKECK